MSFGVNLEKMRRKMGLQIADLERYCGIPRKRLSEFESAQANPTFTEVLALAYVFSTTPQELLDMDAPTKKGDPKQNVPATNQVQNQVQNQTVPQAQAQNVKNTNPAPKNQKDAKKQTTKKQESKKGETWSEDDVAAALMQLQTAGVNPKKEQNNTNSKPMDTAQIQQQAIAHVANAPATPKQTVHATSQPVVSKQQAKVAGKVEANAKAEVPEKAFTEKMQEARKKLNLSYPRICKQLGIRTMDYIQIESGAVQPNAELKAKICEVLQIN